MSEVTSAPLTKPNVPPAMVAPPLFWEKIYRISALRKAVILLALALSWQAYAVNLGNPLLFPTFTDTLSALVGLFYSGVLLKNTIFTLQTLATGYGLGLALAGVVTVIAVCSRLGNDLLELMTSMFNPLPPIALLPLALLWFGIGKASLVFVLIHSVLWPVSLNTYGGFKAVSKTLKMVGQNYGLSDFRLVTNILIPAAFPSILSGLKIGWAFSWRTLIAAELVFGVSSGSGGLGWFIYEHKNHLDIPAVFAGLLTVILIGLVVENFIFRVIERKTVLRWGMHS